VSTSVIVPAILPLVRITVSGQIPVVYEDDINIDAGNVQITGEWENADYIADWNEVVTGQGTTATDPDNPIGLYPITSGQAIPFASGFPSLVLDPAQRAVRLYGVTADLGNVTVGGQGTVTPGGGNMQSTQYNYLLLSVGKIWMVKSAKVPDGFRPTTVFREDETGVVLSTAASGSPVIGDPSSTRGTANFWYQEMEKSNAKLEVTYYNLAAPTEEATRTIEWRDYLAHVSLYKLSINNVGRRECILTCR